MGETKATQKEVRDEWERKLALSAPSRELLEELALACAKEDSPLATFQYAFALSKSSQASELRYAVSILDGLVKDGYEHQVDCMYGSATALYLLGDHKEARARCEAILRTQPSARFAKELHLASIEAEEDKKREQLKTAALGSVGAAAAIGVVAGIASLLLKK
ncbi:predicted protein [Phaeodactylum tricornutum CCAP 1055/1]|jgi:fission 1 protein|uniref:Mitochondrial fission 1 protein n=2 Tax=Phaeodactylum tricornutum TaxID=2850 RepID=B7GAG7_PHATC|nr:predicted protein [Phaeodactylum tricornutum CCAP 1055/1]EEC44248.1 predicted protein [Phaeodactylum tricornutum CCAP 1055/1]|eukprot:XP_002184070.1 predicted protein [Phaeodactylum tricornutum CCAP 1055/1]